MSDDAKKTLLDQVTLKKLPHSNSSMLCTGTYPEGLDKQDLIPLVEGTFGGRFEHFGNGTFRYIAYTD